jgi:hypothetical protein
MNEEYWIAAILSVASEGNNLIIRLEWIERIDPENSVVELRLKGCSFTSEDIALLEARRFTEMDLYFQEEEGQKYLEVGFDSPDINDLRLAYSDCDKQETSYTIVELTEKLRHVTQNYESQIHSYWEETRKLRKLQHRLELELGKEIDRLERKKDFFANTEKASRFDERLQCYRKVLNWIEMFRRDEAV